VRDVEEGDDEAEGEDRRGEVDEAPRIAAFLRERGTTATELIVDLLAGFDVEAALRGGGLSDDEIAGLRLRLLSG
jgi:hypothetical protein